MTQHNTIKLFEAKKVRTIWDDKEEKWYFSIVDVVAVLTDSPNPRKYWSVLKTRLKKEGSELTTCHSPWSGGSGSFSAADRASGR